MEEIRYIEIKNLCKSFDGKEVLRNVCHRFELGKTNIIMGKSGIGKTTLLNIIMGLCRADGGSIENLPDRIAAVFQEDRLCEEFNAETAITMVMDRHSAEKSGFITNQEYAEYILSRLGLVGYAKKKVGDLSGGEKRRVAIARALAFFPELYIFDEAFKGLDGETKREVMEIVREVTEGKTVIMVTHDLGEAEFFGGEMKELS